MHGVSRETVRAAFLQAKGLQPDRFQVQAFDALDHDHSVLVAAPTGSGKTLVAEYALTLALAEGYKAFYTTPLKALSNQKYGDLCRQHGQEKVGLMTGDNVVNPDAPVVVMTTEVLRNMIYAGSPSLQNLRYVVLDEVHYLQNAYRGPVWEEVIIHLRSSVILVGLSATVSNAEEVASWIGTVRGATEAIIEEKRPVRLQQLYMVGDRAGSQPLLLPTFMEGRPNADAASFDSNRAKPGPKGHKQRSMRLKTPGRAEVVELLGQNEMLPAIYFIFSRSGCDEAVSSCLSSGVHLSTPDEAARVRSIAFANTEHLSADDLKVLGHDQWLSGLEAGVAAHHAGMVPPFKEAVEQCFAEGLIKVVFATETLSLGINMPARSVVIEKLTKFTGERHEFLTPGEYTQLTGRAGRRGIDNLGYAVVLWSPWVAFDQVASLASTRSYQLTSSFRPTYNMAANLVRRYPKDEVHHLLNLSFAQYRADSDIVRVEAQIERFAKAVEEAKAEAACEQGDIEDYRRIAGAATMAARHRPSGHQEVVHALERMKPGDVIVLPGDDGVAVILKLAHRKGGVIKLGLITARGESLMMTSKDFPAAPRRAGHVPLAKPYMPDDRVFRDLAARKVRELDLELTRGRPRSQRAEGRPVKGQLANTTAAALAVLPVSRCPHLRKHLRAAERAERMEKDLIRMRMRAEGRTESLARQFDLVLGLMEDWGYVRDWALTASGERLACTYHECDLLITNCIDAGVLDGLDAQEVAAMASVFTYESRGRFEGVVAGFHTKELRRRFSHIDLTVRRLHAAESEAGLPMTRLPDAGFAQMAAGWAAGFPLEQVLGDELLSGGDFVRNIKTLTDLLRQLANTAPRPSTRRTCGEAADALFRGVVAASAVVSSPAGAEWADPAAAPSASP